MSSILWSKAAPYPALGLTHARRLRLRNHEGWGLHSHSPRLMQKQLPGDHAVKLIEKCFCQLSLQLSMS